MTDTPLPAPGWYPAAHANNEPRYWDGAQWQEQNPSPATRPDAAPASPNAKKRGRRGWIIGGSIAAGVLLIGGIGSALGGGRDIEPIAAEASPSSPPAAVEPVDAVEEEAAEPEPEMVEVPVLEGQTAEEAAGELVALGLVPEFSTKGDADVTGTVPAGGTKVEIGGTIVIEAVDKPVLSVGQQNAVDKAGSYLSFSAFSRSGLIEQLEFEGFTKDEATFGVENVGADWMDQAAAKAADYMEFSSFSRQGLIDQLVFEGFSKEQAAHGAAAVGF